MNEKYYPKEIEIVSSYINQFNYSNKYISVKELESLLKKDVPLSIEELEKVLINSSKILKITDFVDRSFYTFLKDDSLKNKGFERFLYEKFKMYFKDNENEIYRFCKEHYILINSFSLKTLLFRYLKENENNEKIINLKTLEVIKKVVKR